jgi:hypothetical protein
VNTGSQFYVLIIFILHHWSVPLKAAFESLVKKKFEKVMLLVPFVYRHLFHNLPPLHKLGKSKNVQKEYLIIVHHYIILRFSTNYLSLGKKFISFSVYRYPMILTGETEKEHISYCSTNS